MTTDTNQDKEPQLSNGKIKYRMKDENKKRHTNKDQQIRGDGTQV